MNLLKRLESAYAEECASPGVATPYYGLMDDTLAALRTLTDACREVAAFQECEDSADWKDAYGRLTRVCANALKPFPEEY